MQVGSLKRNVCLNMDGTEVSSSLVRMEANSTCQAWANERIVRIGSRNTGVCVCVSLFCEATLLSFINVQLACNKKRQPLKAPPSFRVSLETCGVTTTPPPVRQAAETMKDAVVAVQPQEFRGSKHLYLVERGDCPSFPY